MDYEVEQLQHLLDNDPEFVSLIKEANNFSVSRFPEGCASLNVLRTHVPAFIILPIEEFYAQFKCMVMWAVTMERILTKIHGTDKYDESKAFPVGLNGNKNALLYYEDKLSFFIDKMAEKASLFVEVPIKVFSKHSESGTVVIKLYKPAVIVSSVKDAQYIPDLKNSQMSITINNDQGQHFTQTCLVSSFTPRMLMMTIELSSLGE